MQFIDYEEGTATDTLFVNDTTKPTLKQGQVLVKVHSFGINRADTLQRQGKYPAPKGESPILGLEVSGEIASLGMSADTESSRWQIGDEVFALVAGGGYAEYVAVNSEHIMHKPKNVDMPSAAGIAEVFLTAYQSLFQVGGLKPGQRVLIHAGASAVGLAAIQLAKADGCHVSVTASNEKKLAVCEKYGADRLINYKTQNFAECFEQGGVDVIIDFVAGDYLNRNLKILNADGTIVYLAMLAGRYADKLDMALMLAKRATITGSTLRSRSDEYKSALISDFCRRFLIHFDNGDLRPVIDTQYNVKDIALTHERLERNDTMGKLVVCWD
ncbi:quinone oxidoreductase PIG3 [Paraglaciecola mesophila KMM 241]|uniref:Quinone oxidoreductase PIG3 n=1 Tax=Paraglaciecola mesophila KMM 241 TaxID=1128912 RepID=K6XX42_9ALTE|nr:NAD(P)H-quinone oxidoreductase [Paraglaciecola mesophila]GAC25184.1 quinone oxidoreductase PIG3 [Paraglaciecola mesophila KMM 241]